MKTGTAASYRVFVRNWWRWERSQFSGERRLVPDPGARKTTLARHMTEAEALALCQEYARTHKPGPLSRKAEYEREA
jgi:hypothetical protein